MERKAVVNGLCFWNYFGGALLWVLLSIFHFHCFSTLNAFLPGVPFKPGKL